MTSLIETRTQQAVDFINQGGNFSQFVGDEQKRLTTLKTRVESTNLNPIYDAHLKEIQFESIDPTIDYFTLVGQSEECIANQVNSSVKSNLKLIANCYKHQFDYGFQVPNDFSLEQRQALLLVEARQGEVLDQAVILLANQLGIDLEKAANQVYDVLGVGSFNSTMDGGGICFLGSCFFTSIGLIVYEGITHKLLSSPLKLLLLGCTVGFILGALIGYGIYQLRKDAIPLETKKKEILEYY